MLYVSLAVSSILLAVFNLTARRGGRGASVGTALFTIGCGLGSAFVGCIMPAVLIQVLLLLACALCFGSKPRPRLWSSVGATALAYGLAISLVMQDLRRFDRLSDEYRVESLATRLPHAPLRQTAPLSVEAEGETAEWDKMIAAEADSFREFLLERLHNRTVESFVNSPGFGVVRMIRPTDSTLRVRGRDDKPLPQPEAPRPLDWSEEDFAAEPKLPSKDFAELHRLSIVDFVNPRGFGWVIPERRQAAGFQPHHFSGVPQSHRWKVHSIELVGLLMHDTPVVYMTGNLPRMQEATWAPTRTLNGFEALGLHALQNGDNLFVRNKDEDLRVLGALRSTAQCQKCHGGAKGDLLGAFSYQLRAAK